MIKRQHTFTLTELLVVIAIISILATILFPVIGGIRDRADKTKCSGSLRELYVAVDMYWAGNQQRYPSWLSNLYPNGVQDFALFVCPKDAASTEGAMRSINRPVGSVDFDQVKASFDRPGTATVEGYSKPNDEVPKVSYLYEFCGGLWPAGWTDRSLSGSVIQPIDGSWQEMKVRVLKSSPSYMTKMPLIRCFWHADEDLEPILNVSSTGNVFESKTDWQDSL